MTQPDVTILLVTYDRPQEIRRTIKALQERVVYSGKLYWHIADDHTPEPYIRNIIMDFPQLEWSATVTDRKGWGANVNKALTNCKTNFIFLCEDDYVAKKEINLDKGVALLKTKRDLGVVRYDGLAGHVGLRMELREAKTEQFGRIDYLEINRKHSNHLNIYSNRPHLRHRRLHDAIGMYREGLTLGMTETHYAHRVIDAENCPGFAVLPDGIFQAFDHIGKSRQGTDKDPNRRKQN